MNRAKIHFAATVGPERKRGTACGTHGETTEKPDRVTCRRCQKTVGYNIAKRKSAAAQVAPRTPALSPDELRARLIVAAFRGAFRAVVTEIGRQLEGADKLKSLPREGK